MLLPKLWDLHTGHGRNKHTKITKTETSIPVDVTAKGELHKCHEAAAYPLEHAPQLKHLTKQPVQWLGNGIMSAILLGTAITEQRKKYSPD